MEQLFMSVTHNWLDKFFNQLQERWEVSQLGHIHAFCLFVRG